MQRFGYLLDIHGIDVPPAVRDRLLVLVSPTSKVHLGARGKWGTAGSLARPWNVVANVPPEVLREPGERGRRRVSFDTRSAKR